MIVARLTPVSLTHPRVLGAMTNGAGAALVIIVVVVSRLCKTRAIVSNAEQIEGLITMFSNAMLSVYTRIDRRGFPFNLNIDFSFV